MTIILSVIIAALSLILAFQNTVFVSVFFLNYEFSTSLALVILSALLVGFILGMLILVPIIFNVNMKNRNLMKLNKKFQSKEDSGNIMYESEGLGSESQRIPGDIKRD